MLIPSRDFTFVRAGRSSTVDGVRVDFDRGVVYFACCNPTCSDTDCWAMMSMDMLGPLQLILEEENRHARPSATSAFSPPGHRPYGSY